MDLDTRYRMLLGKVGFLASRMGLFDEATGIFGALAATAPDKIGPVLGEAAVLLGKGDLDGAITVLNERALPLDGDDPHARAYLGLAYFMKKETDKARETLAPLAESDQETPPAALARDLMSEMASA